MTTSEVVTIIPTVIQLVFIRTFLLNANTLPVWWECSQHNDPGMDVMSKIAEKSRSGWREMASWKTGANGYDFIVKRHLPSARITLLLAAFTVAIFGAVGCMDSSEHADGGKSGAGPVVLTEANFQAEVLSSSQPV